MATGLRGARVYGAIAVLIGLGTAHPSAQTVSWDAVLDQPAAWYASPAARAVADTVLAYQRESGGWPKDVDMARVLDPEHASRLAAERTRADSTIDNGATVTQLRFLARVYQATGEARLRRAFTAGLEYLFAAQYHNGGWPQVFPLRADYSRHITFNDDAMIGVMTLLADVAAGRSPFSFVDAAHRARAGRAVQRGLAVILAAQVRVTGRLTAWCAQHDARTLEPRGARAYEHAALSGQESAGILRFLMSIERPAGAVIAAIDAGVAWLESVRITGRRLERRVDSTRARGFDVVLVPDPAAPPLWARFYEIGTNRPIFSGRDGVIRYDLAEIEEERRTGYTWIGPFAADVIEKRYPAWKTRGAVK